MKIFHSVIIATLILLCSCTHRNNHDLQIHTADYARHFALIGHDTIGTNGSCSYTEAIVYNPWDKQHSIMERYYLIHDDQCPTPDNGIRIRVPISRAIITSCTHVGFLHELQATDIIVGATDKHLVYNTISDSCINIGTMTEIDAEKTLNTHPDVAFLTTYSGEDKNARQLQLLNLPVIYIHEWTEQDPLARAEWLRFVGAFLDKQAEADSIFCQIEEDYHQICTRYTNTDTISFEKRSILSGGDFRGTWYLPTGGTYMGQLFINAGANYRYAGDTTAASLPMSIESVLQDFQKADVWVGAPAHSLKELADIDERHTWFDAYQNHRVYHFDGLTTPSGGNDFWESGVCHPERILKDLVWALYPETMANYHPYYIRPLE